MDRVLRAALSSLLWLSLASPAAAQTRLYTVDERKLRVLDGQTLAELGHVDLLSHGNPFGIAVASNNTRAYVGLSGSNTFANPGETPPGAQPKVAVVDLLTLTVLRTIDVGTSPIQLAASPSGDRVYVANSGSNTISVIRTADNTVVGTIPMPGGVGPMVVSPNGSKVYTGTSSGVFRIDAATLAVDTFSTTTVPCATGIAVNSNDSRLYLGGACIGTGAVRAYDTGSGTVLASLDGAVAGVAVTPDGSKLIVGANFGTNGVRDPTLILDAATLAELGRVTPSGQYVGVDPSGARAYAYGFYGNTSPNTGSRRVTSLSLTTYTLEQEAGTSTLGSRGLAVAPAASTAPTMALDKTSLTFAAVSTGAAFTSQTPAQTVRLRQSGAGTITWTATSAAPWLVVSPTSGSGPATLSISTQFAPGLTDSQTGSITVALTGASNTVGPISVRLTTVPPSSPASPPFGVFDTPAGDSAVLAGSVAVTGWTLDNIGVQRVELWRDLQPGETTPPFSGGPAGDPRNGKVFIAIPMFVDGARPDIEALYSSTPANYRGGWGYLMLTWGLWNQGNGTYRLYAFAFDQENNVATIGSKTIIVNNNAATKPFGAIDTPGVGGDASGPNFGWALTPKVNGVATCKIPSNGVQVSIDSGPLQPVVYGEARSDIAAAFPGYSNAAAAGGNFIFDWSTLTNGPHTIGWLITDDCNRADGVGSRFFNVTGGTSLTAASTEVPSGALRASETESDAAITVARGYGELPEIIAPSEAGSRTVEVKQGERIEIRLPRGFASAYQIGAGGQRRTLPTGATWDEASGIFYWQPAPAFLGRYRLVFSNGAERISVGVVVRPRE
jgi:YVTN family beta-propeller protein